MTLVNVQANVQAGQRLCNSHTANTTDVSNNDINLYVLKLYIFDFLIYFLKLIHNINFELREHTCYFILYT